MKPSWIQILDVENNKGEDKIKHMIKTIFLSKVIAVRSQHCYSKVKPTKMRRELLRKMSKCLILC